MNEDQGWVSDVLQGNVQAYAHLVNKYKNKVYAIVYRLVRQSHDAQDITQECFLRAFNGLHTFDVERKFSSWLYRIAIHLCYDLQKRQLNHLNADVVPIAGGSTPESLYLKKEFEDELFEVIDGLSEANRVVMLLRYVDGLSYQEMSEILDVPVNVIQVRLHRAKQKLREHFYTVHQGGGRYEMR